MAVGSKIRAAQKSFAAQRTQRVKARQKRRAVKQRQKTQRVEARQSGKSARAQARQSGRIGKAEAIAQGGGYLGRQAAITDIGRGAVGLAGAGIGAAAGLPPGILSMGGARGSSPGVPPVQMQADMVGPSITQQKEAWYQNPIVLLGGAAALFFILQQRGKK